MKFNPKFYTESQGEYFLFIDENVSNSSHCPFSTIQNVTINSSSARLVSWVFNYLSDKDSRFPFYDQPVDTQKEKGDNHASSTLKSTRCSYANA